MSKKAIQNVFAAFSIDLWWADEVGDWRCWARVSDVGCSLRFGAIAVPRRRVGAYSWTEMLHEVAHLLIWRETNKRPLQQNELVVCQRALSIGNEFGFGPDTIGFLEAEIARERAKS